MIWNSHAGPAGNKNGPRSFDGGLGGRIGWSGSNAPFDDIGANLVGRNFFETRAPVSGLRQPELGGIATFREMQKFNVIADILQDADLSDLRAYRRYGRSARYRCRRSA